MNPSPLVSVIVTAYQGARFVRDLERMLVNQTHDHFECLIVDDGSTDGTPDLYRELSARDSRFRLLADYTPKKIVGFGREFAMGHAQGTYVAILDHDDIFHPEKLAKQVEVFEAHPEVDLVYTLHSRFLHGTPPTFCTGQATKFRLLPHILGPLLKENFVGCSSVMVRRSSEARIKGYVGSQEFRFCEDYHSLLRYVWLGKIAVVEEVLTYLCDHGQNMSSGSRLGFAESLFGLSKRFADQGQMEIARKIESQACKTRARYEIAKDPKAALQFAWRSFKLYPRPLTAAVLAACTLRRLVSA